MKEKELQRERQKHTELGTGVLQEVVGGANLC